VIVRKSGGDQANKNVPIDQKAGPAKRVSWRELVSP
jgi:hypothetical protein